MGKRESKTEGWVILSRDGKVIYEYTFSLLRTDAIKKWVELWSRPNNWKAHYYQGNRCVRAIMEVKILSHGKEV